jgi:ABC-2 type transport system ATP-binding protein
VTVFLNSHFLSEVEVTCDRVAIVKRGRVVRMGTLDELTRGAVEVEIKAAGLTEEMVAGLAQWGRVGRGQEAGGRRQDAQPLTSNLQSLTSNLQSPTSITLSVATEDVLPAVAEWLVQGGARLYSFAPQRLSLEELFLRVMTEDV